jgi:hypothetical protein
MESQNEGVGSRQDTGGEQSLEILVGMLLRIVSMETQKKSLVFIFPELGVSVKNFSFLENMNVLSTVTCKAVANEISFGVSSVSGTACHSLDVNVGGTIGLVLRLVWAKYSADWSFD